MFAVFLPEKLQRFSKNLHQFHLPELECENADLLGKTNRAKTL